MNLPFLRSKKYTDPLSVLQSETVGITSAYHNGDISEDELVVAIGEELEKSRQAMREAVERCRKTVIENSQSTDATFKRGIDLGVDLIENHLLAELGLEPTTKSD